MTIELRTPTTDPGWTLEPPPNWTTAAVCAQVDPDLWFPEVGENARPAKRICEGCSVIDLCLEDALRTPQAHDHGVRGGLSEMERRQLRHHRTAA